MKHTVTKIHFISEITWLQFMNHCCLKRAASGVLWWFVQMISKPWLRHLWDFQGECSSPALIPATLASVSTQPFNLVILFYSNNPVYRIYL
jgi:hypothetical protein